MLLLDLWPRWTFYIEGHSGTSGFSDTVIPLYLWIFRLDSIFSLGGFSVSIGMHTRLQRAPAPRLTTSKQREISYIKKLPKL